MAPCIEAASVLTDININCDNYMALVHALRVDHDYILLQYIIEYSHARFQVDKYREHPASHRCSVAKGENDRKNNALCTELSHTIHQ